MTKPYTAPCVYSRPLKVSRYSGKRFHMAETKVPGRTLNHAELSTIAALWSKRTEALADRKVAVSS